MSTIHMSMHPAAPIKHAITANSSMQRQHQHSQNTSPDLNTSSCETMRVLDISNSEPQEEYDTDDDVTLIVEHLEIVAPRMLLAAQSPFFRAKFDAATAAADGDRLTLHGISAAVMPTIVKYLHTGNLHVHTDNAQALFEAAELLHLHPLRDIIAEYLDDVRQQVELQPTEDSHHQRRASDAQQCPTNWTDLVRRANVRQYAEEMLPIFSDGATAISALLLAVLLMVVMGRSAPNGHHDLESTAPQVIMVLSSRDAHLYDFEKKQWSLLERKSHDDYTYHAATKLDGKLYLFARPRSYVAVYDPLTGAWTTRSGLRSDWAEAGVAALDGCIYLVGGRNLWDSDKHLATVRMFHERTGVWQPTASMATKRSAAGVAVLDGLLYAVGGFDGTTALASAERYDADTNRWSAIASMNETRTYVGVCAMAGKLYAVGGERGANMLPSRTAEVYDPIADVWRRLPAMQCRRSKPSVVTYAGELYVMGGTLDRTIEVFSPVTNTWRRHALPMPQIAGDSVAYVMDRPSETNGASS